MSNLESPSPQKGQLYRTSTVRRSMPSVANPANQQDGDDITLSFVLGVWNQWWKWLIPASLILIIASAAIVMITFKPKYHASSRIEILEHAPWVIQQDTGPQAHQFVATQIEILRSPRVLQAVLEEPKVAGMPELKRRRDPVKWLADKGLEIEPVGQSTLVEVGFDGVDPVASAHLVNTVVANYFDTQSDQKTMRVQKVLKVLRNRKTAWQEAVSRLKKNVQRLSKDLDDVPHFAGPTVMMTGSSTAQEIMNAIQKAEFELDDLVAAVFATEDQLADDSAPVSPALVQNEINSLPEVNELRQAIQKEEAMLGQIEATAAQGKESTYYINAENRIAKLRFQLDELRARSEGKIIEKVREMSRMDVESLLKQKRRERDQKALLVQKLEERYRSERANLASDGGKRLEFDFELQELQRALGMFAKISERESQMTAELGAPGRPEVFRRATPNYEPVQKYPLIELAATTLGSLVIPFGIAFLWENSVRRISSVEQLQLKTNIDVIGEVSRLPARQGRRSRVLGHELGLFEESIDSLRTSLLLANEEHDMQVIAVASAVSGEGKTSVSSQLAVSIARATGQPVLLVDGDMRAPDIHSIFDVPNTPGLVDVLGENASLEEAINRSWSEHVHLLPAGELDKSPHKLLGTAAFGNLLNEARLWYRYIVIDTPPVLAASESLVIAKQADGTIVCAMRDFSRESHVRLAHTRLRGTGADIIGTVLNGVPVRSYASRYGSYGSYGYQKANQ